MAATVVAAELVADIFHHQVAQSLVTKAVVAVETPLYRDVLLLLFLDLLELRLVQWPPLALDDHETVHWASAMDLMTSLKEQPPHRVSEFAVDEL